jgi:hypothetical protein
LKKNRNSTILPARRAAGALLAALALVSCAHRAPSLVPPASDIEAAEGRGSASIEGRETALRGKFAFHFRRPGLGRIEVSDPFGTSVYFMLFKDDTAYLVVPSKKIYAEERPETLMDRFLGFSLRPDEVLRLLAGQWEGAGPAEGSREENGWSLQRDGQGRVVGGRRGDLAFEVDEFFPGAGVPRVIHFSRPVTSGRMKILSLRFNPPARPETFETAFLGRFGRRSFEELQDVLKDER